MPRYEFLRDDGSACEFWFSTDSRPELGQRLELPDGTFGYRVLSIPNGMFFGKNHSPSHDDERRESVRAFDEPNPANPGSMSDREWAKKEGIPTMACSRWI